MLELTNTQIGRVLPILSRAVLKAVLPDIPHEEVDYNVVQNNGESCNVLVLQSAPARLVSITHRSAFFSSELISPLPVTGPGAAQVVPHVHFHIVPRPPLNYKYPPRNKITSSKNKYPRNSQPAGRQATAILFGRGMREDLDYDEAAELVEAMRAAVKEEWQATFPAPGRTENAIANEAKPSEMEGSGDGGSGRRGAWKV